MPDECMIIKMPLTILQSNSLSLRLRHLNRLLILQELVLLACLCIESRLKHLVLISVPG